jgi:arabinofuranosyltransferase
MALPTSPRLPGRTPWLVAGALGVALVLTWQAWLCDDAFITFRIIDNFHNGYGLTWNVGERVQASTHPLWLFVVSSASSFTGELPVTTLVISLVLSMITVVIVVTQWTSNQVAAVGALVVLVSSRAFVEYSTSGLENCLSHLLAALFLVSWFRWSDQTSPRGLWSLGVCAGLMAFTRIDLVTIVGPALIAAVLRCRPYRTAWRLGIAGLPLVMWFAFSTVYYGFALPNTAWAKQLGTGVPRGEQLVGGFAYLLESLLTDPVTLTVIAVAFAFSWRDRKHSGPMLAGIAANLAYVVWVGGDFMSGRFLTVGFLVALVVLLRALPEALRPVRLAGFSALLVSAALSLVLAAGWIRLPFSDVPGVSDEADVYSDLRLLKIVATHGRCILDHPNSQGGLLLRQREAGIVEVAKAVGLRGFHAGPRVHIIDALGLTDPLIARLPVGQPWRAGHYPRLIPAGYPETVATGRNLIDHPDLAAYYEILKVATQAPFLSRDQLRAVAQLRTSAARDRLMTYRTHITDASWKRFGGPPPGPIRMSSEQRTPIDGR